MPQDYSDKMTAKGVKTSFVRKHLQHETFVHSLKTHSKTKTTYLDIRSKNHSIHTVAITKDCLNPFDDKRYILDDGVESLSFGHCKI